MKKTLLLASILLFAQSSFAQLSREPIFKAGVTVRGLLNVTKSDKQSNYNFSGYNGGALGLFFAMERRHFRFELDADFGISNYNLFYQHPTLPSFQYNINKSLFTQSYQISASKKIHLPRNQKIILGIGINILHMPTLKKNDFPTHLYSFYDEDLGNTNNRITLVGIISQYPKGIHNGFFFQLAHHFNQYRFPFFIRLNNYIYPGNTFNRQVAIISYNSMQPNESLDQVNVGKMTFGTALTLGVDLWHSKLKTRPISNT